MRFSENKSETDRSISKTGSRYQRDPADREEMICRNIRLVFFAASVYAVNRQDREEYISAGTVGLIRAVDTYDPERNCRFSTYAVRCICNEIQMEIRRLKRQSMECPQDPKSIAEKCVPSAGECADPLQIVVRRDEIRQVIRHLSESERQIFFARFEAETCRLVSQTEAAKRLGISQSYFSRRERAVKAKVLDYFNT